MDGTPTLSHADYTVGWVCALSMEMAAARLMLDHIHTSLPQPRHDHNSYILGRISNHNVAIACMPSGVYGTTSAAVVAQQMLATFPNIQFGLMVGIGGGVPGLSSDIRLGDVVVGKPMGRHSGVMQYDFGKTMSGGRFHRQGALNKPPQVLLTAVANLEAVHMTRASRVGFFMEEALGRDDAVRDRFSCPGSEADEVFESTYEHEAGPDCGRCDRRRLLARVKRKDDTPRIYHGLIASANQVMKHGPTRDQLASSLGILCFEMEAAGLMDNFPCLVVRGICDYADSHKNKQWQGYAALSAAAYTKELLGLTAVNQRGIFQTNVQGKWMVPFPRNPRFVGREDEIVEIQRRIQDRNQTRKSAIAGLGGMGKTQVALEVAFRVRHSMPEYSIFWVPSTSTEAIEQMFLNMGNLLELRDVTAANAKKKLKAYLSSEQSEPWLLIIDNADDMDMWMRDTGSSTALKNFLPQSPHGFTLFTTRNLQLATKLTGPDVLKLSKMDDEMATELLNRSLIQANTTNTHNTASLLRQLSCLPLAIIQAASYINENSLSIPTYLSLLDQQETGTVELLSQDFEDEWRYDEIKNPVAATWLISFHHIRRLSPLAAEYLSFMACIDHRDIPTSLLPEDENGTSEIQQQNALGVLKSYSFITKQTDNSSLSLHRLVHLATRNWLRNEGMLVKWGVKTGTRVRNVFPINKHEYRALWRQYLPHAQYVLQDKHLYIEPLTREDLAELVGKCLYDEGRYHEAGELFQYVFRGEEERFHGDRKKMLRSIILVAMTHSSQGRWPEAEVLQKQVVEFSKDVLGPEHPDTLSRTQGLAKIYRALERWEEAESLSIQAVEGFKKARGLEDPKTLDSMDKLMSLYLRQRSFKKAEKLGVEVLEKRQRVLGTEHIDTALSLRNLATTYQQQGRLTESEELNTLGLRISQKELGPEHPKTLMVMRNLVSVYRDQGKLTEAEDLGLQVLTRRRKLLGPEDPYTRVSMSDMVSIYRKQGKLAEAEDLAIQILDQCKRFFGPEHRATHSYMSILSSIYQQQRKWTECKKLRVEWLEITQRVCGPEHEDTLVAMTNLVQVYCAQGRWNKAEELDREILAIRTRVSGPRDPETLLCMRNLALTLKEQNQRAEALDILKRYHGYMKEDSNSNATELAKTEVIARQLESAEEGYRGVEVEVAEVRREQLRPEEAVIESPTPQFTMDIPSYLSASHFPQGNGNPNEAAVDVPVVKPRKRDSFFRFLRRKS